MNSVGNIFTTDADFSPAPQSGENLTPKEKRLAEPEKMIMNPHSNGRNHNKKRNLRMNSANAGSDNSQKERGCETGFAGL
jgi:hypothetical protein